MEYYEKKYKDVLAKAREIHRNENEKRSDMEWLFPELKESGDERIRKALVRFHKSTIDIDGIKGADILAWLEKQGQTFTKKDVDDAYLKGICDAKHELDKQGNNTSTIIWHSIDEKPEEMKELFCEWESDDAIWHDVAFYDEESHTFRHAKMPINVTKWVYVDELLGKQGEQKPAVTDFNAKDWYVSEVDGKIHDMTYNPADKVEPRFKVKYAGSEYNVLEVKDIAGVTFYGIEDEPNHIDYVKAENCEIISGYAIKENGSPYPTKPAVFSEKKPTAWSEKDEKMLHTIIADFKGFKHDNTSTLESHFNECIDWLKSLKDRVQPKQEWSEEDENYLQSAENACEYQYGKNTSTILWLKHLKDRIGG